VKRREVKGKGVKERYTHLNAEFRRIARRHKKAFLSDQCKDIEENNRMGGLFQLFWEGLGVPGIGPQPTFWPFLVSLRTVKVTMRVLLS